MCLEKLKKLLMFFDLFPLFLPKMLSRIIARLEEALQHISANIATQQHTHGPGRLPFDIPSVDVDDDVLSGLWAPKIGAKFSVSTRIIRHRLRETSLRCFSFTVLYYR